MAHGQVCTICTRHDRAEIDSLLNSGQSGHRVSKELGVPVASLYRHIRSRHHKEAIRVAQEGTALAVGTPNGHDLEAKAIAEVTESLRDARRLQRLAWKHLKETAVGSDPKATNGAIAANNKTLELIAELRGHLNRRGAVTVTASAEASAALDLRSNAEGLGVGDVAEAAGAYLRAQLEAGDRDAMRIVLDLVRMLPSAEVAQGVTLADNGEVIAGETIAPPSSSGDRT
jgi:hypothetical protein